MQYAEYFEDGSLKALHSEPLPGITTVAVADSVKVDTAPATAMALNRIQFYAMVELLGKSAQIEAAIDAIPDVTQKAVAKAKYKHSSRYDRDDPLFAQLAPAVGLTDAEIDAAWAQAVQIV